MGGRRRGAQKRAGAVRGRPLEIDASKGRRFLVFLPSQNRDHSEEPETEQAQGSRFGSSTSRPWVARVTPVMPPPFASPCGKHDIAVEATICIDLGITDAHAGDRTPDPDNIKINVIVVGRPGLGPLLVDVLVAGAHDVGLKPRDGRSGPSDHHDENAHKSK